MVLRHMLPQTPSNGLFEYQEPIHAKFDHPQLIKLDDGWPESKEEQGLLLLGWRHHITKQYIKDVL